MTDPASPSKGPDLRASFLGLKSVLYDRNTGLYTYPYHFDDLQHMVEWHPTLGVLVVEVFDFDRIEWLCGWQVFDGILRGIARELRSLKGRIVPESSLLTVSGVHGGGFVLFVPETVHGREITPADLEVAAAGIRRSVARAIRPDMPADFSPELEIGAGYSLLRYEPVFRVERLVYRAIESARAAAGHAACREEQRSGTELRQIIRAGLLETLFQPILDLTSREVFGYEALARGPRGTPFENPNALFGVSERMRISPVLDSVCRRRALRAARALDAGKKLFLNSLPATLADPHFEEGHAEDLRSSGGPPAANLVLEITERTGINDFEQFGRQLERLRAHGYQVAIDDVGTGYSSLRTISEVRPEFLKIDRSLVKNIHQNLIKQEIVSSILQIGERIRARVIAEGIESDEEFEAVKSFGVRLGQGYYFGAPAPHFPRRATRTSEDH